MRILNWVQNKLINGRQDTKKTNLKPPTHNKASPQGSEREEFKDWPNAILTIGTFGYKTAAAAAGTKENTVADTAAPPAVVTPEELNQLQNELNAVFVSDDDHQQVMSPVVQVVNSALMCLDDANEEDEETNVNSSDVCLGDQNKRCSMRKKSVLLLKKMFACRSGFVVPTIPPALKPVAPVETRMAKILRAILHKKIYPQQSGPIIIKKKYLNTRHMPTNEDDHDNNDDILFHEDTDDEGCKWVKTDTEYIVLEI